MCKAVKPLVAGSSYNMLARSCPISNFRTGANRKRNFYNGILIALYHEPDGLSL